MAGDPITTATPPIYETFPPIMESLRSEPGPYTWKSSYQYGFVSARDLLDLHNAGIITGAEVRERLGFPAEVPEPS